MIKISSASNMTHKKISRNKLLIEICDISQKIIEVEQNAKEYMFKHYDRQKELLTQINGIETLQINEYTIEREKRVNFLTGLTGHHTINLNVMHQEVMKLQDEIKYKRELIKHLQDQIPRSGTVTNISANSTELPPE